MQRTQELQATRPGVATLADAGGENVRGLVERIAQTPGAGRTTIVPALTNRQQGQLGRLSSDLQSLTGTRGTASQAIAETMEQRAATSRPLYDEAMNWDARSAYEVSSTWQHLTSTGWGMHIVAVPIFANPSKPNTASRMQRTRRSWCRSTPSRKLPTISFQIRSGAAPTIVRALFNRCATDCLR